MNRHARLALMTALVVGACAVLNTPRAISAEPDFEASLRRGAVEDVTPAQKYQSAIREAGGAYKEALRECAGLPATDRGECNRAARVNYDREMAEARAQLAGKATEPR